MIKDENTDPNFLNLVQNNINNISQLKLQPMMITRAITANRPINHNIDEKRSSQSMITRQFIAQVSKHRYKDDLQFQTQTNSVVSSPNINNTETRESIPHTVVLEILIPTSFTLVSDLNIPLQVPTKPIQSNSDTLSDPTTSEKFASHSNDTTYQHFHS